MNIMLAELQLQSFVFKQDTFRLSIAVSGSLAFLQRSEKKKMIEMLKYALSVI